MEKVWAFINTYGHWFLLLLAIIKALHILAYAKDFSYVFHRYFRLYTSEEMAVELADRFRFRLIHNFYTYLFYVLIVVWIVGLIAHRL